MKGGSWLNRLPEEESAVDGFPVCEPGEPVDLRDTRVVGAVAMSGEVSERPEVVNVVVERCDVAGFTGRDGRAERLVVSASRLRGVTWVNGIVQDAVLDGVIGDGISLRFSTLRRVTFRDCVLPGLDLTETKLEEVRFERCALPRAQLNGAKVKSLRIEGCDLAGATGVAALAGASIHPDDLLALAPSLAEAIGMRVSVEGD